MVYVQLSNKDRVESLNGARASYFHVKFATNSVRRVNIPASVDGFFAGNYTTLLCSVVISRSKNFRCTHFYKTQSGDFMRKSYNRVEDTPLVIGHFTAFS
jgi:hypothetical protein